MVRESQTSKKQSAVRPGVAPDFRREDGGAIKAFLESCEFTDPQGQKLKLDQVLQNKRALGIYMAILLENPDEKPGEEVGKVAKVQEFTAELSEWYQKLKRRGLESLDLV